MGRRMRALAVRGELVPRCRRIAAARALIARDWHGVIARQHSRRWLALWFRLRIRAGLGRRWFGYCRLRLGRDRVNDFNRQETK